MSAFLLTSEHIAQLAIAWGKFGENKHASPIAQTDAALTVAAKMAWTNFTSVQHRYSNRDMEMKVQDYIIEVLEKTRSMKLDPKLSIIDLYRMVDCYAYQSCEWHKVWDGEIYTEKSFIQGACDRLKDDIIWSDTSQTMWTYDNDNMPREKLDYRTLEPMETIIARYDLDCWVAA